MTFASIPRLTALSAGLALALAAAPAAAERYVVGLLLPFSGVYAGLGAEIENGFMLGLEHFGDALGPHTIEIKREDSEAKANVGLAKARKLTSRERADALVGVVSSAVLAATRDHLHGAKTPLIVTNAGNDLMTGERCSPYVVRVSFSNSQMVRPMGPFMAERGIKTAYLLAPDYAAGHQMMTTFKQSFEAAGGKVLGEAYPPLRGVQDYGPYLTAAKASGAEAVFAWFAGGSAVAFVKQHHAFGLKESLPLYGPLWIVSPLHVEAQGAAAIGVIGALNYAPILDNPENARFQQGYKAAHDGKAGSEYAVAGYDAARLLIEAIAAVGEDKAALAEKLRQISFDSPRGPLKIDPATNNVIQTVHVFETIAGPDGAPTQKLLTSYPDQQDPPMGCVLE